MTFGPWLIWYPALALINLLVFIAIRGRWGRSVLVLAVASLAGVAAGDRIGDMHVVAASVTAQLFMVAVSLLTALAPMRRDTEE